MNVAGIDMGSVATKVVLLGDADEVLSYTVASARPDAEALAWSLLNQALVEARLKREDLSYIVGTGYGRYIVPFANENRTEIMCHAVGVNHLFPTARTIIDIGGQDSKAIRITKDGRVRDFVMSDRCAAGTGRFCDVMAKVLRVPLEKWGEMLATASKRAKISSTCTVFAETEVISQVAQKTPVNEIIAGLCESLTSRVLQMAQRLGFEIEPDICFTGGVAMNAGIVQVLKENLGESLLVPEQPQSTGALGAAILAKRFAMQGKG